MNTTTIFNNINLFILAALVYFTARAEYKHVKNMNIVLV